MDGIIKSIINSRCTLLTQALIYASVVNQSICLYFVLIGLPMEKLAMRKLCHRFFKIYVFRMKNTFQIMKNENFLGLTI